LVSPGPRPRRPRANTSAKTPRVGFACMRSFAARLPSHHPPGLRQSGFDIRRIFENLKLWRSLLLIQDRRKVVDHNDVVLLALMRYVPPRPRPTGEGGSPPRAGVGGPAGSSEKAP